MQTPNEHAGFPSLYPPKKEQAPAPKEEPKDGEKQAEPCANINPNCKKVCENGKK
jgi:hypothetical protein